jgi:hypothetical protein
LKGGGLKEKIGLKTKEFWRKEAPKNDNQGGKQCRCELIKMFCQLKPMAVSSRQTTDWKNQSRNLVPG